MTERSPWTVTCARKGFLSCLSHCILCVCVSPQFSLLKLAHCPDILVILRLCLVPQMTSLKPAACVCIQRRKPAIWKKCWRERQTTDRGSTCTALPLTSEPMEAAVAIVLGTVAVLVSQMCREDMGMFNSRLATYEKNQYFQVQQSLLGRFE